MEPLAPGRTLALPIRARFVTLRGYQYCPSDWRMPYIPVGWFFAVLPLSGGGTLVLFVPVAGQAAGSALRFPQDQRSATWGTTASSSQQYLAASVFTQAMTMDKTITNTLAARAHLSSLRCLARWSPWSADPAPAVDQR